MHMASYSTNTYLDTLILIHSGYTRTNSSSCRPSACGRYGASLLNPTHAPVEPHVLLSQAGHKQSLVCRQRSVLLSRRWLVLRTGYDHHAKRCIEMKPSRVDLYRERPTKLWLSSPSLPFGSRRSFAAVCSPITNLPYFPPYLPTHQPKTTLRKYVGVK